MKAHREPLSPAHLEFDAQGVPASALYGDIYHSRAGALDQAHHVFIQGNGLPQRWAGRAVFTVCETGFGLGNNFLALWRAWRLSPQRPGRLHVLSFEAHPFARSDLVKALAGHDGPVRELADALVQQWPVLLPGIHRLEFEGGQVTLTLAFGRVEYLARQVDAGVDAFFLDGFAPAKNPAMWSRQLFGQLVRIANQDATAASWCSAGQVRRDLSAAGFVVSREPGFGGKREMSRAVLRPGLGRPLQRLDTDPVLVVGGGLAGAGMAWSLALRGHTVTVLDPIFAKGPAGGHTGHRSAAMTPALSRDDNSMSRLSRAGILLAQRRWAALNEVQKVCGSLLRIAADETRLWQQALQSWQFPEQWAAWCPPEETETRIGLPLPTGGVWLPVGSLLRPERLVTTLLAHERITVMARRVESLQQRHDGWHAIAPDGSVIGVAPRVVLAAAADTPALLARSVPEQRFSKLARMQRMGGQVAYFRADRLPLTRAIVAGAGYWLPQDGGVQVGGSSYVFEQPTSELTEAGFGAVVGKVADLVAIPRELLDAARATPEGWAGWRAALSDHLPVMGPADADRTLWLACAYGSRGLSWMTLAGEIMAAELNAEPQVLERELLHAVRPR